MHAESDLETKSLEANTNELQTNSIHETNSEITEKSIETTAGSMTGSITGSMTGSSDEIGKLGEFEFASKTGPRLLKLLAKIHYSLP